jgi:hypothetical protein
MSDRITPILTLSFVGGLIGYSVYREFNPTIEDLKRRKQEKENQSKANLALGQASLANDEWERRCLEAGEILPR